MCIYYAFDAAFCYGKRNLQGKQKKKPQKRHIAVCGGFLALPSSACSLPPCRI